MARTLRDEFPGAVCDVIGRGNNRSWIFREAETPAALQATLFRGCDRKAWLLRVFGMRATGGSLPPSTSAHLSPPVATWPRSFYTTRSGIAGGKPRKQFPKPDLFLILTLGSADARSRNPSVRRVFAFRDLTLSGCPARSSISSYTDRDSAISSSRPSSWYCAHTARTSPKSKSGLRTNNSMMSALDLCPPA